LNAWNKVMDLLRDGEWHSIKEMQETLGRSKQICLQVANFLVSYNFCDRKPADGVITKIRLRSNVLKFLDAGVKMNFQEFLSLCKEADDLIIDLKSPKLWGKRPTSLKAATIHYLARKKGLNITLCNLYTLYGCHPHTIIDAEKIIRELDSDRSTTP